jgi:hypothetical protein
MDPITGTLLSATALAAGAYLNAKFAIGTDLKQLRNDREWARRLGERVRDLGDECTFYGMFDRVDVGVEALWFEGRTWTYGELKKGEFLFLSSLFWGGACPGVKSVVS